jgi:predicted nucleic acid-binding Zn ribbon protein
MKAENSFITHCKQCTQPYEAQRSTSRFCSDKCRLKYNRRNVNSVNTELECLKAAQALDRLLNLSDDALIRDAYQLQMVLERAEKLRKRRELTIARFFGDTLPEES